MKRLLSLALIFELSALTSEAGAVARAGGHSVDVDHQVLVHCGPAQDSEVSQVCLVSAQGIAVAGSDVQVLRVFYRNGNSEDFPVLGFFPDQNRSLKTGEQVLKGSLVKVNSDSLRRTFIYLSLNSPQKNGSPLQMVDGHLPDGTLIRATLSPRLSLP